MFLVPNACNQLKGRTKGKGKGGGKILFTPLTVDEQVLENLFINRQWDVNGMFSFSFRWEAFSGYTSQQTPPGTVIHG